MSLPADVQLIYAAARVSPAEIPFDVEHRHVDGEWIADAPLGSFLDYVATVERPLRVREPRKMAIGERTGAVSLMYEAARLDRGRLAREIPHRVDVSGVEPRVVLSLDDLLSLPTMRRAQEDARRRSR